MDWSRLWPLFLVQHLYSTSHSTQSLSGFQFLFLELSHQCSLQLSEKRETVQELFHSDCAITFNIRPLISNNEGRFQHQGGAVWRTAGQENRHCRDSSI